MKKLPNTDQEICNLRLQGIDLIACERSRQMHDEGYLAGNDDSYVAGEIALAAVAYASPLPVQVDFSEEENDVGDWQSPWKWASCENKKKEHCRLKQLVIAGALIAAEIDRIQRDIERTPEPVDSPFLG